MWIFSGYGTRITRWAHVGSARDKGLCARALLLFISEFTVERDFSAGFSKSASGCGSGPDPLVQDFKLQASSVGELPKFIREMV